MTKLGALARAVVAVALPALALAQAPQPAAPSAAATAPTVRVFHIQHADMQELSLVLPPLLSEGSVLTVDGKTRTVTVVDQPEFVQRVESWLKEFDIPPDAVLVRIVLEKAERSAPSSADVPSAGWTYRPIAETTLEVIERGTATQSVGEDGAFEIRVKLGNVDAAGGTMRFDEIAVSHREPATTPGQPAVVRDVFSTSLDARDRVGKVVMATRDPAADAALVLRLLALIREQEPGG